MRKLGLMFMVMVVVIAAYIIMIIMQPVTNEIIQTANTTANWAGHPDYALAQSVLLGWRWWVWFIPGALGVAVEIIILKSKDA